MAVTLAGVEQKLREGLAATFVNVIDTSSG